ncbi:MAG: peptidoglycan DD-metalloendopeptidase family protein [Elusimicrobiota bacterium]
MLRLVQAAVLLILIISVSLKAGTRDDIEKLQDTIGTRGTELSRIEEEIKKYGQKVSSLGTKEKTINMDLDLTGKRINNHKNGLISLGRNMVEVEASIHDKEAELKIQSQRFNRYSDILRKALLRYSSHVDEPETELWPHHLTGPEENNEYIDKILVMLPAAAFIEIDGKIKETGNLKKELELQRESLILLKEEFIILQDDLILHRKKQLENLKKVKKELKTNQETLDEKRREHDELNMLVSSLKKKVKNLERLQQLGANFDLAEGKLPWPVDGKVSAYFGKQKHPKLETVVFNRGISISPDKKENAVVKAVADGEVVFSDTFEGLNKMVVIDHGNGYYTIYGNLEMLYVRVGLEIEILDSIGSISDGALYFELGQGSEPRDPLKWLNEEKAR